MLKTFFSESLKNSKASINVIFLKTSKNNVIVKLQCHDSGTTHTCGVGPMCVRKKLDERQGSIRNQKMLSEVNKLSLKVFDLPQSQNSVVYKIRFRGTER